MKYNKYVFVTGVMEGGKIVKTKVIVELTTGSTEAMRMVIEDWNPQEHGDLRSIELVGITSLEQPEEEM